MEFLYQIFGWMLFQIYGIVHSYGISIIIFTIFMKVLLPLNIKRSQIHEGYATPSTRITEA